MRGGRIETEGIQCGKNMEERKVRTEFRCCNGEKYNDNTKFQGVSYKKNTSEITNDTEK